MIPPLAAEGTVGSGEHFAFFGNIRVIVMRDGNFWFAQGVEIDYFAQGDTVEQVQRNFERGFVATVQTCLDLHGTITPLLKWAPIEAFEGMDDPRAYNYTQVSLHEVFPNKELLQKVPFDSFEYGLPQAA